VIKFFTFSIFVGVALSLSVMFVVYSVVIVIYIGIVSLDRLGYRYNDIKNFTFMAFRVVDIFRVFVVVVSSAGHWQTFAGLRVRSTRRVRTRRIRITRLASNVVAAACLFRVRLVGLVCVCASWRLFWTALTCVLGGEGGGSLSRQRRCSGQTRAGRWCHTDPTLV
jgi:hypothetical protein